MFRRRHAHETHPRIAARATRIAGLFTAIVLALAACGGRIPFVYRIDIQQGNVLSQEQLAKLEYGMEKRKVRFILGTPLLTDAFNQDRWDYYYSFEEGGGDKVQRQVSVFFRDERLVQVSGDVTAASGPILLPPRQEQLVKVPEGLVDDGLLAGLTPDFFSNRPKRIKPKESEKESEEGMEKEPEEPEESEQDEPQQDESETMASTLNLPAADSDGEATEVVISESETEALASLLTGYGQRNTDAPALVPGLDGSAETEQDSEEGLFKRWARRLGIGDDDEDEAPLDGGEAAAAKPSAAPPAIFTPSPEN